MNTQTTNPSRAANTWTHFSRTVRGFFGAPITAGLTAALFFIVVMAGCRKEVPGIVSVCNAPTVIRTTPTNGGTNEPLNKTNGVSSVAAVKLITATFSTPMDPNTINGATFTVQQGGISYPGSVSYTDTTAIFVLPNGLSPSLSYTCTITTGARDLAGIPLASNYVWTFSTIATGTPILVAPADASVNQATTPMMIWNAVAGANTYRLQLSTNSSFASMVYDDSTRTNTSQSVPGLAVGTTYYWRVDSKISGGTSAYSSVWSFTTIGTPAAPVLIAPLDVAINIATSPNLSWNASPGAATYHLQVSTSNTFAVMLFDDSTLTGTSQSINGLSLATGYYWRVNAKNVAGTSAYSSRSFTTIAAGTPTLVAPLNGALSQSTNPTLIWNLVPGANTYRLQVSTSNTFAATIYDDSTRTVTSQAISGLTVGTTYYWRVNSKTSGTASAYSDVWSFTTIAVPTAPVLVAPVNTAINQLTNPTLIWNGVVGAATYRLQVSTSNTFVTTIYDDSTRTIGSQAISGLAVGTTYYWRVNAKNAAGTSSYSIVWSFATVTVPAVPVLVVPVDAAINQPTNPILIWNGVPGAATYRLQVSTGNTFATTVYDDSTRTTASQAISGLAVGTTYYWRVNAKNAAGTGGYSIVWSFTTVTVPAAPVLVVPLNAAVNQPTNPTLIWNGVPGAATYRLQVSTGNTFATTVYDDSTRTTTSQAISGLSIGTTYYWRVNTKNAAGTSNYSTIWSFTTIVVPAAPSLVTPLNASINQASNPTLVWNAVAGADTYRLQVSISNTFGTTIYNDSTRTTTSQAISGLGAGTTYYWRLNAKNVAGTSAYSAVWSFTTATAPSAPSLVSPLNAAVNQPVNPTLIWNGVSGANTYRLQVSTVNTFATTVYDDSTRVNTSQALSGLTVGTTYYWRVNAKDASGTSVYSTVWNFKTIAAPSVPILSAPVNGASSVSASPKLSWLASTGADTYRLQVSTDSTFTGTQFDDSSLTSISHTIAGLTSGNIYYWRVNAKNSSGTSAYSTRWSFKTGAGSLGSAGTFGIMATSAVTNTGNSIINGDVSLNPGTSITGFTFSTSPGPGVVNGAVHINDGVSAQARADLLATYNYATNLPAGTTITGGADLGALYPGGMPPGTYTSGSTMLVSTPLVLDAGGDANAVWVFQIGSSLTTGANVSLLNGAQAKNVFWVPVFDATIGVGTIFYGTIVSGRDVTAVTGAIVNGRILAGATTAGTIALQDATVNVPAP